MSESKHTPGLWETMAAHIFSRCQPGGANICSVSEPRATPLLGYTELEIRSKDSAEAYANAAFIVRACNAHYDLLAALQECADDLASEIETRYRGIKDYRTFASKYQRDMAPVVRARAAIAKATGSSAASKPPQPNNPPPPADIGGVVERNI